MKTSAGVSILLAASAHAQTESLLINFIDSPARLEKRDAGGALLASTPSSTTTYDGAAIDASGHWITTSFNPKGIVIFDRGGSPLTSFPTPQVTGYATDPSVFADGTIAVCDYQGSSIDLY